MNVIDCFCITRIDRLPAVNFLFFRCLAGGHDPDPNSGIRAMVFGSEQFDIAIIVSNIEFQIWNRSENEIREASRRAAAMCGGDHHVTRALRRARHHRALAARWKISRRALAARQERGGRAIALWLAETCAPPRALLQDR
ncbi:hypothetical protein F511_44960 [Dorcoceras hygrometricum]|uniref:Uncharacterized protein n=1 Tax=Dorcoceras hygrometricum TaxID=472368 RepID=A0A2Z7AA25_9LAMI|nr:hypothetical protein F511_44960 [Dorcoceras hygrometricum]